MRRAEAGRGEGGGGYLFHPWTSPIDRGVLRPDETHPLSARPPICRGTTVTIGTTATIATTISTLQSNGACYLNGEQPGVAAGRRTGDGGRGLNVTECHPRGPLPSKVRRAPVLSFSLSLISSSLSLQLRVRCSRIARGILFLPISRTLFLQTPTPAAGAACRSSVAPHRNQYKTGLHALSLSPSLSLPRSRSSFVEPTGPCCLSVPLSIWASPAALHPSSTPHTTLPRGWTNTHTHAHELAHANTVESNASALANQAFLYRVCFDV